MDAENNISAVSRIERELEDLILSGEYGPGDRIKENAVAARFGVSRAPVREACRLLQRSGLVRIVPNQGSFVSALSLTEIVDLFDVRACLGRLAGSLAAAAITREGMQSLRDLIAAMEKASRAADAKRYIALNIAFHASLYASTGNERLAASNVEHRAILAVVERGDCLSAGSELEKHIQNGRDRFIRAMSATGQLVLKDSAAAPAARKKRNGKPS
jgi:DNA-binding GntR family transcriptional regulator